ncbi:hypothetical protein FFWV33_02155 [Flavobacterium faecale]|uniref:Uncharacterized protein n=1 Tax=Flavobacterium faecale TaxID=1355330 RepID=A0A2S1L9M0_9FLAO|nr:hypothetical protein FFWV33_02155 [Flavobacterium faecale]
MQVLLQKHFFYCHKRSIFATLSFGEGLGERTVALLCQEKIGFLSPGFPLPSGAVNPEFLFINNLYEYFNIFEKKIGNHTITT